jgi:hypothetical protein
VTGNRETLLQQGERPQSKETLGEDEAYTAAGVSRDTAPAAVAHGRAG